MNPLLRRYLVRRLPALAVLLAGAWAWALLLSVTLGGNP